MASNLQNVYYERKTGSARPCYICRRPTQTVLSTLKTEDFLYICDNHLTDPGFASLIPAPAAPTGPTPEEIQKVIADYKAKEAAKATKDDTKDKEKAKDDKPPSSPVTTSIPSTPAATAPSHRKFSLHRSIFDMRKNELRKREQGAKAKEVSRGLPQVPRGSF